jgi:hypothetical protein
MKNLYSSLSKPPRAFALAVCLFATVAANLSKAATIISAANGNWSSPATWGGVVPGPSDDVVIKNGTTVTINTGTAATITVKSLTVGQGTSGTLVFEDVPGVNFSRSLVVTGDLVVNAGARFFVPNTVGNGQNHQLTIGGNLVQNSTQTNAFDFSRGIGNYCNVIFNGVTQTIVNTTGAADKLVLHSLKVAEGTTLTTTANFVVNGNFTNDGVFNATPNSSLLMRSWEGAVLELASANPSASTTFYNLTIGINGGRDHNRRINLSFTANQLILDGNGNDDATLQFPATGTGRVVNVTNLSMDSDGFITMESSGLPTTHSLTVAGIFTKNENLDLSNSSNVCNVTMSGKGSVFAGNGGNFNSILLTGAGAVSNNSDLSIKGNLVNNAASFTSTAGRIIFDGGKAQQISGTGATNFFNLSILNNSTVANLARDITIQGTGSGAEADPETAALFISDEAELNAGSYNITFNDLSNTNPVRGFYSNGKFNPGTGTVIFSDAAPADNPTSGGTRIWTNTTFYNVQVTSGAVARISSDLEVNVIGNFAVAGGTFISTSSQDLVFKGNLTNTGTFTQQNGTIIFDANANQMIGGTGNTTVKNIIIRGNGSKLLTGNVSVIGGNISVLTGATFDLQNYTANRSANGGTLTLEANARLRIGGEEGGIKGFPVNYNPVTLDPASTVEYYGKSASIKQTIATSVTYGNLVLAGTAEKTFSSAGTTLTVRGNLMLNEGKFSLTNNSNVLLAGNFMNNIGSEAVSSFTTSTFILNGTAEQTIDGAFPSTFARLTLNGSGKKVLKNKLVIANLLTLNNGILETTDANTLTLQPAATIGGTPSNSSYVSGPINKETNSTETFVFPTGKGGRLGQVAITPTNNTPTTFKAQYYAMNPTAAGYNAATVLDPLINVSAVEYWTVDRVATSTTPTPTAGAQVRLYWYGASGIKDLDDLRVARWNGSAWEIVGKTTTSGAAEPTSGSITSNALNNFSPITFGSTDPVNPLPVTWLSFTGKVVNQQAELTWKTSIEIDNAGFEVEKSEDQVNFRKIGFVHAVDAPKNENRYTFIDQQFTQSSYYRLKQVDKNGKFDYSKWIYVETDGEAKAVLKIKPNPVAGSFVVEWPKSGQVRCNLFTVQGIPVLTNTCSPEEASHQLNDVVQMLPTGVYILNVFQGEKVYRQRIVKQ